MKERVVEHARVSGSEQSIGLNKIGAVNGGHTDGAWMITLKLTWMGDR